jgi:hypothetical protein
MEQDKKNSQRIHGASNKFIHLIMKKYSVTFTEHVNEVLLNHLIRNDRQEDLCFATYAPSTGERRFSGIINSVILPLDGERKIHGNAEFFSSYLLRSIKIANERKEGLVFLHSHPGPGWQGMSVPDIIAEKKIIAPAAYGSTGLPLLGLTVGSNGIWSARFWLKGKRKKTYIQKMCESVRVVGKKLSISFNENLLKSYLDNERQLRTISSWGRVNQENLSRLRIGIIGLGSVGSIVAEILARTGITQFTLIDFDSVETKNLDRTLGAHKGQIGWPKVMAISKSIKQSASAPKINVKAIEYSICEKEGYASALDCDIVFSCVDKPWARQILNYIAYTHLIPVIDGGIKVRTNGTNTKLLNAHWKAHISTNDHTCLECIGQYDAGMAKVESEGFFEDPKYIQGMTDKSTINGSENVFLFSSHLAAMEVLQFISFFIAPGGLSDLGKQIYQMSIGKLEVDNTQCHPECFFQKNIGKGDLSNINFKQAHIIAEKQRSMRGQLKKSNYQNSKEKNEF